MLNFDSRPPKSAYYAIRSLHKFWIRADLMKSLFFDGIKKQDKNEFHLITYMDFWYGSLNIVLEGYIKLKIQVPEIDNLISNAENREKLKLYRHGTFHYFEKYWHNRLELLNTPGIVSWVHQLHEEFAKYLYYKMLELQETLKIEENVKETKAFS